MVDTIILISSVVLLVPGIILSVIPNVPGLFYMLLISICFAVYDHFVHVTAMNIVVLSSLVIVATAADMIAGIAGAKWGGARWSSLIWGLVGMIIGTFVLPFPILGGIIGMFIGILLSEWQRTKNLKKARVAAVGSFAGTVSGMLIKIIAAVVFVVLFIIFALN